ncbi:phosphoglycolate phosphatase [Hydrogenimonas sp.]|nr:phosphoglycolate phosphatase [Hydrogenimonas sp.]
MTCSKGRGRKPVTILFDLDGTLIDSTEAILESFYTAFGEFGGENPERDRIERLIGHPLDRMFASLGVESEYIDAHVEAYKRHYRKVSREKTTLLPGAAEAVRRAYDFALLGVVTTKTGRYSVELLEHMGLMSSFDVLIGREDVVNPKPHPEPILKALDALGRSTENCWMVGDTLMDVDAARAAGVKPFALTCGYADASDLESACEHLAPDALSAVSAIYRVAEKSGV